jgi:hypothetical protein
MLHHLNGMAYIYSFGKHHSKEKVSKYSGGSRQISISRLFRSFSGQNPQPHFVRLCLG